MIRVQIVELKRPATTPSISFLDLQTAGNANKLAMQVRAGDLNGDGREDVVWIHAMDQTRIYVAWPVRCENWMGVH